MNDLFYRKEKRAFDVRALLRKLARNKRAMVSIIIGLPLLLFVLFGNHGILQRFKLQRQKAELETKVQRAEEQTRRLESESKALDGDKRALEKIAREKYGMHREGETVYKINKKKR